MVNNQGHPEDNDISHRMTKSPKLISPPLKGEEMFSEEPLVEKTSSDDEDWAL